MPYKVLVCSFIFILCIYSTHGDLYNSSDSMVILDYKNFYNTTLGVQNAWIIEFYNSWCGHCINYAPVWREFASNIQEWGHTIKVAALDCSDDENVPICRDYEVMTYPSVRLFGANLVKGIKGENVVKRNALQESVIEFLIKEQLSNNGSKTWIFLPKYKGSLKNIFESAPKNAKNVAVIVDKPESIIGPSVALDLGNYPMVNVRSVEAGNNEIQNINSLPAVIVIDKNGKQETLQGQMSTREDITALLIKKLQLIKELALYNKKITKGTLKLSLEKEEEGAGDGNLMDNITQKTYLMSNISSKNSTIYIVDIENALSYALRHEIALHKVINGESLSALQNFLHIVLKFLPMRPQVNEFMTKFVDYIDKHNSMLHGEDIGTTIQYLNEQKDTRLPDHQTWIGCLGSQPKFRGYTCGLWTLFHTLTVNAVLEQGENSSYDPKEVLRGIHNYVKYYFSCENCSQNFQKMYNIDAESFVQRPDDGIIWLWKGHNKVNLRLKGDLSEDPIHLKHQFPSQSSCRACWMKNDSFNENEVLKYLKELYGKDNLSLNGVQDLQSALNYKNKQSKVSDINNSKNLQSFQFDNIKELSRYEEDELTRLKQYSWGFNNTDFSLCVTLYIFSTLMIFGCYSLFIIKRRLRKRKFIDKFSRTV